MTNDRALGFFGGGLRRRAQAHPAWLLGFEDEVWWSRLAPPALRARAEGDRPLRPVERAVAKDAPDQKALACYGLLLPARDEVRLRFLDGRPVSAVTPVFPEWCRQEAAARGKAALLLVWDNASWHVSQAVRGWIRDHNRRGKASGEGVRPVVCPPPIKSPWLNPIEPKWVHTKRQVVEPDRLLPARELAARGCKALDCVYHDHIPIPEKAA
ncbi:MAG TPA: transposase [Thermomicrobiales bacterium]|nr:transposase [Thermomicrobiales bacterium]